MPLSWYVGRHHVTVPAVLTQEAIPKVGEKSSFQLKMFQASFSTKCVKAKMNTGKIYSR